MLSSKKILRGNESSSVVSQASSLLQARKERAKDMRTAKDLFPGGATVVLGT